VSASEAPTRRARDLRTRYTVADLEVLTAEEAERFVGDGADDPRSNPALAWELLYRREPELYERLVTTAPARSLRSSPQRPCESC
jgi:hypothetical protein